MFAPYRDQFQQWTWDKLGIELTATQLDQFCAYGDLLLEWNKRMNLTRITDEREVLVKHFLDSMAFNPYLQGNKVVDIGTGAGFPGLPLKILNPEREFVLVDSLSKRLDFLNHVIAVLGLRGIKTVHARAEDFGRDPHYRQQFDTAVARALARLPVLLEYVIPALKVGGLFVAAKGPQVEEEIEEAKYALQVLGSRLLTVETVNLGEGAENHALLLIQKLKDTPKAYPRKAGVPQKKPLLDLATK